MKNNIKNLLTGLFTIFCFVVSAQNIQPSMMVLPYTDVLKEGAPTALERYEAEDEYKAVVAGIEQAIIDRGGELQDLQQAYLNAKEQMVREGSKYKSIDDAINQNASAEVIVLAEITYGTIDGKRNLKVRLKAVETSSGQVIYPGLLHSSPLFPMNFDYTLIASKLLTAPDRNKKIYIDDFLNGMQAGFTKMIENGRPIVAIVLTDDNSSFTLNQEANDEFELIADKIDEWVSAKAINGNFRVESSSDNRLEMTVKIPMRDASDRPYSTKKFAKELRIAILKICAKASATVGTGERPDGSSMQENIDKGTIMLTMPAVRF